MFATIRRYKGFPQDKMDEIVKRVTDGFLPIISASDGFINYRFVDSGGGIVTTVSVFETMEASVASNKAAEKSSSPTLQRWCRPDQDYCHRRRA